MPRDVLTICCNPSIDKTIILDDFVCGQEHLQGQICQWAGGKGINVSRALKGLGISSEVLAFLGGGAGDFILHELKREKLKNFPVPIHGETRTNLTILNKRKGQMTRVLEAGPKASVKALACFKDRFRRLLPYFSYVVLSGSLLPETRDDFYYDLILMAKRRGKFVVLDADGQVLRQGIKAGPDLVKLNHSEAADLLGEKLGTWSKIKYGAVRILRKGIPQVIISWGAKGALGGWRDCFWYAQPPQQIKGFHTIGSGDALTAGFIYGHRNNFRFEEILKAAVAAGTANCETLGPGEINFKRFLFFQNRVGIRRI